MAKRNHIRKHAETIKRRIINIIRHIEAHDASEEGPGAECARAERCDLGRDFAGGVGRDGGFGRVDGDVRRGEFVVRVGVVEARCVLEGCVGLD